LAAGIVAYRIVRRSLPRIQGLFWVLVWLAGATFIIEPAALSYVASWLGIGRGSDLVFYLAILAGMWTALHSYSRYRRLETIVTELVRRDSLDHARRGDHPQPD
jgi:hypothetical protein